MLLSMSGIVKNFGGVPAVSNTTLELQAGEVHALIGQNGAGKSTLIKVLTGIYERDSGEVLFEDSPCNFQSPGEAQVGGIATIYQELNLVPLRSVTENVMMGYEPKRFGCFIDWNEAHKRTRDILARFDIDIDVTEQLGKFSTAIQQLVAIARAVSLEARLVIMDEPTSSLDASEIETLFGVVRDLRSSGVTVLYVSHFLEELYEICDRVTVMRDGQTVAVHEIQNKSKLELIGDMLGRDADEIEKEGMTQLGHGFVDTGELLLEAINIGTGQRLKNFNLSLHRGEIVGLGGLLGAGRTEAARALFGIDPLITGKLRVSNQDWTPLSPREAIEKGFAFLTEDRKVEGIIPDMSVRENLTLALLPVLSRGGQIDRAREKEIVQKYISDLGIKTAGMEQPIRELSGGNQQKVLLARWLITNPAILILDEPTRGVDVGAKREIQLIIRDLVEKGVGVILISSEFEEIVEGANRIIVLHEGESVTELTNPGITETALINALAHGHVGAA